MGGNEGGGRGGERWSLFGVRPIVQKSPTDPGSETNTPGKNLLYGSIILALNRPDYNLKFVCFSFILYLFETETLQICENIEHGFWFQILWYSP